MTVFYCNYKQLLIFKYLEYFTFSQYFQCVSHFQTNLKVVFTIYMKSIYQKTLKEKGRNYDTKYWYMKLT
jgi:hypothetical protein